MVFLTTFLKFFTNPSFHLITIPADTYFHPKKNMVLYNSSNLRTLSNPYDAELNGSCQTPILSGYQDDFLSTITGFLSFIIVVVALGVFINIKFLNNIRNEERKEKGKILQRILKNSSIAQMIFWPTHLFLEWLVRVNLKLIIAPVNPCFYHYAGLIFRSAYHAFRLYIGFSSMVVAICRICFIVYDNKISNYGVDKFRKIIYYGSILVPLGIAIFVEGTILPQNMLMEARASRCTGVTTNFNDTKLENLSPIYALVQKNVPSYITMSTEVVCYILVFVILSNIIEGIIYWYTWSYIKW